MGQNKPAGERKDLQRGKVSGCIRVMKQESKVVGTCKTLTVVKVTGKAWKSLENKTICLVRVGEKEGFFCRSLVDVSGLKSEKWKSLERAPVTEGICKKTL